MNPTLPVTELNRVKAPVGQAVIRFDSPIDVPAITVNGEEIASSGVVKLAGTQTITGAKTFSVSPVVPTPSSGNNTTAAASTAFVQAAIGSVSTGPAAGRVETDLVTLTPGTSTATTLVLNRTGHVTGICGLTSSGRTFAFSNDASDSTNINIPWPSSATPAMLDVNGVTLTEGGSQSFGFQGTVPGMGNAGDITLVQGTDFMDVIAFKESTLTIDCSTLPDTGTQSGEVTPASGGGSYVSFSLNTDGAVVSAICASLVAQMSSPYWSAEIVGDSVKLTSVGASGGSSIFFTTTSAPISASATPAGDAFDPGATLAALATAFNGTSGAFGTMTAPTGTQLHLESFAFGPDAVLSYSLGPGTPVATPGACAAVRDADCATAWATAYNIVVGGTPAVVTGTTITVASGAAFVSAGGPTVWTITPGAMSGSLLTHSFGSGRLASLEISTLHAENLKLTIGGTDRTFTLAAAGVYDLRDVVEATGGIIGHIRTATDQTIVISAAALSDDVEVSAVVRKS